MVHNTETDQHHISGITKWRSGVMLHMMSLSKIRT